MSYKVKVEGETKFFETEESLKEYFSTGMKLKHIGGTNYDWYRENTFESIRISIENTEDEDFNFVNDIRY